jgi:hypothetical protein
MRHRLALVLTIIGAIALPVVMAATVLYASDAAIGDAGQPLSPKFGTPPQATTVPATTGDKPGHPTRDDHGGATTGGGDDHGGSTGGGSTGGGSDDTSGGGSTSGGSGSSGSGSGGGSGGSSHGGGDDGSGHGGDD